MAIFAVEGAEVQLQLHMILVIQNAQREVQEYSIHLPNAASYIQK